MDIPYFTSVNPANSVLILYVCCCNVVYLTATNQVCSIVQFGSTALAKETTYY